MYCNSKKVLRCLRWLIQINKFMKSKITWCLALGLLFLTQLTFAQQKTISGTVTDQDGLVLPGVNIVIKGTSSGTQTDFDGNYEIIVSDDSNLMVIILSMLMLDRHWCLLLSV